MRRLALALLVVLLPVIPAAGAPVVVEFTGVVGGGSDLATLLPGVTATDALSIRFTWDDAASDTLTAFPGLGAYPAVGAPYGAEITIGSHVLASDSVSVSVGNDQSSGDSVGFRTEIELDGVVSAYTVGLIDPTGTLLASDGLEAATQLASFPQPADFRVTGVGGMFVWLYHVGPVHLVPEPEAADYVTAVAASGPLTVFAPTNDAFAALPEGTVESLLEPENADQLREILRYRVTRSALGPDQLRDGQTLGMANGAKATIRVEGDAIWIDEARVIGSTRAENGMLHVIDGVLLPPEAG